VSTEDKYGPQAERWTEEAYANPARYLEHRAQLIAELGPPLQPGTRVLDLACGDGGLAAPLEARGLRYLGVDSSAEMVAAARARGVAAEQGDLNRYVPAAPVAATTVFRAIYYAADRRAFFHHAAGFTERKLVFDLNPRQFRLDEVRADLRSAGWTRLDLRPFFVPQTRGLWAPAGAALELAENSGPLARLALRFRFTYVCAASGHVAGPSTLPA